MNSCSLTSHTHTYIQLNLCVVECLHFHYENKSSKWRKLLTDHSLMHSFHCDTDNRPLLNLSATLD